MKIVPYLVLGIFVFSIFSIPLSQDVLASVNGGIPPTKAFPKVSGHNATGGNGLLTAKNYSDTLHLRSNSLNFSFYQKNNTLDLELKSGNASESTTASNLLGNIQWFKQLVGTDLQFYGMDVGSGLSFSKNTTTYKVILNFKHNSYNCPAGQFTNGDSNVTGVSTCGIPSGSASTYDTMQNIGSGQASVYAGNTTKTNFQFKTITVVHGSITNGTNLITITIPIYQNNTGQNLGTHGIGPYFGMSGSVLQFLSDLSANSMCTFTSNSTNLILTCNAITSINSQTGPSITIQKGTLGNTKVTTAANVITIESNNTAQGSNLGTHGIGPYASNLNATKLQFLSDVSANSMCTFTSNSTNKILTCNLSGITTTKNGGRASISVGTLATPTSSTAIGRNMSSADTGNMTITKINDTDIAFNTGNNLAYLAKSNNFTQVQVISDTDLTSGWNARVSSNTAATSPQYILSRTHGTEAAKTAVLAGDRLGLFGFGGYVTAFTAAKAFLLSATTEAWTSTAQGTYFAFFTTNSSTTSTTEKLRINDYGGIRIAPVADVSAPTNGDFWLSTTNTDVMKYRSSGTTYNILSTKDFINFTSSSNKTGTTGFVMLGDGVTHTPAVSTRAEITVSGYTTSSVSTDGGAVQIRQITGGCPVNGAAVTGTALGSNIKQVSSGTTARVPFSITVQTNGLSIGTKYCFELTQQAITGGTFTVFNVMWATKEI